MTTACHIAPAHHCQSSHGASSIIYPICCDRETPGNWLIRTFTGTIRSVPESAIVWDEASATPAHTVAYWAERTRLLSIRATAATQTERDQADSDMVTLRRDWDVCEAARINAAHDTAALRTA